MLAFGLHQRGSLLLCCLVVAIVRLEMACSQSLPAVLQTTGEENLQQQQTPIKKLLFNDSCKQLEDDGRLLSGSTTAVRCLVCCLVAGVVQLEV